MSGRTVSKCSLCKTDHSFWNVKRYRKAVPSNNKLWNLICFLSLPFKVIKWNNCFSISPEYLSLCLFNVCLSYIPGACGTLNGTPTVPFLLKTNDHVLFMPREHHNNSLFFLHLFPSPEIFCHKTFALTYSLVYEVPSNQSPSKAFHLPSLGDIISKQLSPVAEGK